MDVLCIGLFAVFAVGMIWIAISWSRGTGESAPAPGSLDEYLNDPAGTPMSNVYKLGDWTDEWSNDD